MNATAGAGFVFFTIDPSDFVDPQADDYAPEVLGKMFMDIRDDVNWADDYIGRTVTLETGDKINFDLLTVRRAAVKYGRAISHAVKMGAHIDRVMGKRDGQFEIELSVDETPQPTTPAEHYIIAEQCLRSNMRLVSLAPRYVGDFRKGSISKATSPPSSGFRCKRTPASPVCSVRTSSVCIPARTNFRSMKALPASRVASSM